MRNRPWETAIGAIIILALVIGAGALVLHAQKEYVPKDTVSKMDVTRSQVYVTGKGYKVNKGQKQLKEKTDKEKEKVQKKQTASQNNKSGSNAGTSGTIDTGGGTSKSDETLDPSQDPDEEKNHDPTIKTDLRNGQTISGNYVSFYIIPRDYKGRHITAFTIKILVNGTRITSTGDDGNKINYRANLKEGVNVFTITAKDTYGNSITVTRTVKCDSSGKPKVVGTVTVTVRGDTVGLGAIVSGTVDIYKGDQVSYVLDRFLKAKGYGYNYTGSLASAFYLADIKKSGIAAGAEIPDSLKQCIEESGLTTKGHRDDALGENDFVHGSGWMYSVNGDYPERGLSEYTPSDEDDIVVAFSLHDGKDIKHIWKW